MKIAVTSQTNSEESSLDPRFGRCAYFAVYDTVSERIEFLKNPNKDALEGAGPATVQFIASHGVSKVLSGDFGAKIRGLLDSLNIEMEIVNDVNKSIKEIIKTLK